MRRVDPRATAVALAATTAAQALIVARGAAAPFAHRLGRTRARAVPPIPRHGPIQAHEAPALARHRTRTRVTRPRLHTQHRAPARTAPPMRPAPNAIKEAESREAPKRKSISNVRTPAPRRADPLARVPAM